MSAHQKERALAAAAAACFSLFIAPVSSNKTADITTGRRPVDGLTAASASATRLTLFHFIKKRNKNK